MIHFDKEIRNILSAVTQVPVLIQYPDSRELPVIIVLETSNSVIRDRDNIIHLAVSFFVEVWDKDLDNVNGLVDTIDNKLSELLIIRNGISHHNSTGLYGRQLSYRCEVLYNKKTNEYTIHNNN